MAKIADAVLEGKAMRKEEDMEGKAEEQIQSRTDRPARKAKVVETDEELEDNALLGESTLAQMSAAAEADAKPADHDTAEKDNLPRLDKEG